MSKTDRKQFKINSSEIVLAKNRNKLKQNDNEYELDLKNTNLSFVTAKGNQAKEMVIKVKTKQREEEIKGFKDIMEEYRADHEQVLLDFGASSDDLPIGINEEPKHSFMMSGDPAASRVEN